eukprot:TRINITY_DN32501_c0_g1_i1.p1 TRINITY_DN32501_c0_g1~~TRINITY_DN32501_c0_g1_i1.p1  ORF type:complete len:141 (-),score=35.10 TRINITY_DN32501_c0_g1_i1:123-545(-)
MQMYLLHGCMSSPLFDDSQQVVADEEVPLVQRLAFDTPLILSEKLNSGVPLPRKDSDASSASTALPDEMSTVPSGTNNNLGGRWLSWDADRDIAEGRISVDDVNALSFALPQESGYQAPMRPDSLAYDIDDEPDNRCFVQ